MTSSFEVFSIDPKEKRKRFKHTLEAMMHAWQGGSYSRGRMPRCRRGLFNSLTQDCGLLHLDPLR